MTKLLYIDIIKINICILHRRYVAGTSETCYISKKPVINYYGFFRSVIFLFLESNSMALGGDCMVINFDKTPITHRHG